MKTILPIMNTLLRILFGISRIRIIEEKGGNMKKIINFLIVIFIGMFLTGCSNKITTEDLKANDWEFKIEEDEESLRSIASFSDHIMTLSFDADSLDTTSSNEWEELGAEIGKQFVENIKFKIEYELSDNMIHLKDNDLELDHDYTIEKEDKNIVLTPTDDTSDKLVLKPYTKKEKSKNTTIFSSNNSTPVELSEILDEFTRDGLEVTNPRNMTKDDFGMAPLKAEKSMIFGVQLGADGEYQNARIFSFNTIDDLNDTKKYYDELGERSPRTFSFTASDEDKKILMQFNGDLPQDLVEKYVKSAGLTLTPIKFAPSSSEKTVNEFSNNSSRNSSSLNSDSQNAQEQQADSEAQRQQEQQAALEQQNQQQQQQQAALEQQPQNQQQAPALDGSTTIVQQGEGLQQVANRTGVSVETLAALNGITIEGDVFYPAINAGQTLRIR